MASQVCSSVSAEERKVSQGHGTCTCSSMKLETAQTGGLRKSTLNLCGEGSLLPPGCKSLQAERTGCGPPFLWYPLLLSHNQQHLLDAQQGPVIHKSSFLWLSDGTQSKSRSALCPSCRDGRGPWPAHRLSSSIWLHVVSKHSGVHSNFKLNRAEHMAT